MASEGAFGSNVRGTRAAPVKFITAPAKPIVAPAAHLTAAPHIHVSPLHASAASLKGPSYTLTTTAMPESPGGAAAQGGSSNPLSAIVGGVEGFIGHLSTDVVHTAMGLPVGIAYMFEHPIAGAEGAVKATWADWSPLFHGNVDEWAHNFYEHPLAPLLDIASLIPVVGWAARGVGVAGAIGETAVAADEAAALSAAGARAAVVTPGSIGLGSLHTAQSAGELVGRQSAGMAASEWWMKAQRFANPSTYAAKTYGRLADSLGYTGEMRGEFINGAMARDPLARRIFETKSGIQQYKAISSNPLVRIRQAAVAKYVTDPVAASKVGQALKLDHVMGYASQYRKLSTMDAGVRRAAMRSLISRQVQGVLGDLHRVGEAIHSIDPVPRLQIIEPGMRTGLVDQAHQVAPAGAIGSPELDAQVKAMTDENRQFVSSDAHAQAELSKAYDKVAKNGEDGFDEFLKKDWSAANTTNDPAKALVDANGNYRVVSAPDKIAKETFFSHGVVKALYTNPTKVWKYLILGASPRYFVNNFVGNTLMLMAATDPVTMTRAFHGYMTAVRGANKEWAAHIEDMMGKGATPAEIASEQLRREVGGGNWMDRHFAGEFGFGEMNMREGAGRMDRLNQGKFTSLHYITNKFADMPQRYAALNYSMKRIPEFQQEYARLRAGGMSHFEAENRAAMKASESPAVRMLIRQQVHHMLGQYHTFSKGESAVRQIIPFYAWDRAIAVHMKELIVQQPYKVAMGAAIGTVGSLKTQEIMGQVPDFMRSVIPAKILAGPLGAFMGQNGSRMSVINAASLNPYGTVADITKMGVTLLPGQGGLKNIRAGDSLGATLNPLIQSVAQQLSGTDLQTGATLPPNTNGPLVGAFMGTFGNVPQLNLLKAVLGMEGGSMTSKGKPTLYAHNIQASLSSWLGMPIRQVDVPTANAIADKTSGVKHRKNTSRLAIPGL